MTARSTESVIMLTSACFPATRATSSSCGMTSTPSLRNWSTSPMASSFARTDEGILPVRRMEGLCGAQCPNDLQ